MRESEGLAHGCARARHPRMDARAQGRGRKARARALERF